MDIMLTGRFKLRPVDDRNWELCEMKSPSKGKDAGGEPRWVPLHRYYSYQGLPACIQYVADLELKDDERGSVELYRAIDELAEMYAEMVESVRSAVGRGLL